MRHHRPVVAIDGFLDTDLDADESVRVILENGQFPLEILEIVLEKSHRCDRLAYGSGFEARPELLEQLGTSVQVLGNDPDIVRLCADPLRLSDSLARLGLTGPETRNQRPDCLEGWLVKQKGRSGGDHVHLAVQFPDKTNAFCWQRQCLGEPHSALFLAGGKKAQVVGISQLLPSGVTGAPYAWSGAVGPVEVLPRVFEQVQWAARVLARDLDLLGLCGIDFIVDPNKEVQIVDLNPRLVATCELYADCFVSDYMNAHIETCLTGNPSAHLIPASARGKSVWGMQIVYAPHPVTGIGSWAWPEGTADLPEAGTCISTGQPLCTVRGHYHDADEARTGLQGLGNQVLAHLESASHHPFSSESPAHEVAH